ncbi:MAG: NAD(P)/FAD-dependent oxidoreductase [bacterium]|nr:NAD(P)/FAD-dependent oxidoreductase [bacterium]
MKKRIAIIGGGFAGLGAAWELSRRRDVEVHIFERSPELGGLAGAFPVGDSHLEQYYHHMFPEYHDLIELSRDLGLEDKVFFKKASSGSFVDGKMYPFSSAFDVLRFSPLAFVDRLRLGLGIAYLRFTKNWKKFENITASAWLKKFFGERIYEVMWRPLLVGKFGERADDVGMVWFWSRIYERPGRFGYIQGGFKTLTNALGKKLEGLGVRIHLNAGVTQFTKNETGKFIVSVAGSNEVFDAVLVAATPMVFLRLAPWLPETYCNALSQLKYCGTISVVLTLDRSYSPYYWLNIQDASLPVLAVVEHTNFVGPEHYGGNHLLYVAKYIDPESSLYRMPDADLLKLYFAALKKINPAFDEAWVKDQKIFRAPATQPIAKAGYQRIRPEIKTPIPNLYFVSMSHIYPWDRGTERSFCLGKEAAILMMRD